MKRFLLLALLVATPAFADDDQDSYSSRSESYADRLERMFPTTGVQPPRPAPYVSGQSFQLLQPPVTPPQQTVIVPLNGGSPIVITPIR